MTKNSYLPPDTFQATKFRKNIEFLVNIQQHQVFNRISTIIFKSTKLLSS